MNPSPDQATVLVIACGAIAREILKVIETAGWRNMRVECLPAQLHNRPGKLPETIRAMIRENRESYERILVLYSDCGTGGGIQAMLDEEGIEGIGGAHCYEVFAGSRKFRDMMEAETGTFFVTDFLARNFETLVFKGLGLDRHPDLRGMYFGNYRKLVYLTQNETPELRECARKAARSIGLELEIRQTDCLGYEAFLAANR